MVGSYFLLFAAAWAVVYCAFVWCASFCFYVAAGPQKYPQNDPQSPQNRPQRPPKASQNWPKMTPEAPWGPPGGPKSSLFWRGSIFEAILDPKMEPKWTPKSTKSLHFLWKSGLSSLFGHMFPALQMFSHLLVKFASVFGRPNPWKPWFSLGKTTILKKPLFFKRWPKQRWRSIQLDKGTPIHIRKRWKNWIFFSDRNRYDNWCFGN